MADFKSRFLRNILNLNPRITFRITARAFLLMPVLLWALLLSWIKIERWSRKKKCREFLRKHKAAFPDVDDSTLEVLSVAGGVSNSNQIWKCRRASGEEVCYFVKIFVPAGSFWARHLSAVSPFPSVKSVGTGERFAADARSRVELSGLGIPVPKLVASDAHDQVMVTECLEGKTVDAVLQGIAAAGRLEEDAREAISQCGVGLAKIHKAGFALIDTQPVNCIWAERERKVYFTDLEFCTKDAPSSGAGSSRAESRDQRIWDVGFFLCFLALRIPGYGLKKEVRDLFLKSYQNERRINLTEVTGTARLLREYYPVLRTILDLRQFTPDELFAELIKV